MPSFKVMCCLSLLSLFSSSANTQSQYISGCCSQMGGISYCDSSAGRLVCRNGFYSTCYCTPHAVMNLQLFRGCCLWRGGILPTYNLAGGILCRDGSISEECSLQPEEKVSAW